VQSVPSETLAIDRKARMKVASQGLGHRPPEKCILDFDDVVLPLTPEQAQLEALRCIHCPDPAPCTLACPTHNDIPSALWLIEQGRFIEAAELYRQTSSMPEICGRVCPHDQLCQNSCVRNKRQEPVLTGALEVFAADYQRAHGSTDISVGAPTGKRVAIVGAGPSGMACAEQLLQSGYQVTIFDAKPAPGGLLLYGIPNFKLPKDVVMARWDDLERAGVEFVPNTYIGKDKTVDDLFAEGFEAVFLGVGTGIDAPMKVPGEDLPGVYKATEFLIRGNVDEEYLPDDLKSRPEIGKKVAVIGGGDTASDCLRTALRLGAEEVTCLYRRSELEMPGGKKDRQLARDEGAQYQFLTQPVKFIAGEDGRLEKIECIRMRLEEPEKEGGRRRPVPIEGTNFLVEADTAILALGYWPDETIGKTTPGLETRKWGLIVIDQETGETSRPGVYAGGDAVTGPDLVVTAMVAGRKAAHHIDTYLNHLN
jgi:glutamate synthase (NADPH/NADH) small chain